MNQHPHYSMRQYVAVANIITSGNLTAGFLALLVIMDARLLAAFGLIALAAVFDLVDGPLARRHGGGDSFGTNLDSLSDLVSFGAAPALALYVGALHRLPVAGFAACLAFVLASAWRLARFPLCKDDRYFVGCPVPVAGVLVGLLAAVRTQPALALPVVVVLCILMVSTIRVPTASRLRGLARVPGRDPRSGQQGWGGGARQDWVVEQSQRPVTARASGDVECAWCHGPVPRHQVIGFATTRRPGSGRLLRRRRAGVTRRRHRQALWSRGR